MQQTRDLLDALPIEAALLTEDGNLITLNRQLLKSAAQRGIAENGAPFSFEWINPGVIDLINTSSQPVPTSVRLNGVPLAVSANSYRTKKDTFIILVFNQTVGIAGELAKVTSRMHSITAENRAYFEQKQSLAEELVTLEKSNAKLLKKSNNDSLTGLLIKAAFEEQAASRLSLKPGTYFVAFLDIDDFKSYNDHYGHLAGDNVLKTVGASLKSALRRSDLLARFGGEEFVALVKASSNADPITLGDRMVEAVRNLEIPHVSTAGHGYVTASVGVCKCSALTADGLNACLTSADEALYEAKRLGKNQCIVAPQKAKGHPCPESNDLS